MGAFYPGHRMGTAFWHLLFKQGCFVGCMLPTYCVVAMLSMSMPTKRTDKKDSATTIITVTLPLDLKVDVYFWRS